MSYTLPSLPYSYDELEPYFDKQTMKIHHTKHHQAYINNTNSVIDDTNYKNFSIKELISKLHIISIENKVYLKNNAGGHFNHSFFWKGLKLHTSLKHDFRKILEQNFGSLENFKTSFEKVSMNHFGSGWAWLIKKHDDTLYIASTANQDNPLMGTEISGLSGNPILGLDLWEHAYYLKYKNNRMDYIRAFWNVINWDKVRSRFFSDLK